MSGQGDHRRLRADGATLVTKAVADAAGVGFYSTYGWHPLSVAAALANLKYWSKHRTALLANVATQGDSFRARLSKMKFREQAAVRVLGLAIGIEFGEESHYASQLGERCRKAGLLVSAEEENLLTMFPALTIDARRCGRGWIFWRHVCEAARRHAPKTPDVETHGVIIKRYQSDVSSCFAFSSVEYLVQKML